MDQVYLSMTGLAISIGNISPGPRPRPLMSGKQAAMALTQIDRERLFSRDPLDLIVIIEKTLVEGSKYGVCPL